MVYPNIFCVFRLFYTVVVVVIIVVAVMRALIVPTWPKRHLKG